MSSTVTQSFLFFFFYSFTVSSLLNAWSVCPPFSLRFSVSLTFLRCLSYCRPPFCLLASASLSLCLSVRPSFLSPFPVCTCFFVCLYLFNILLSLSCLSLTPGNELAFYVRCINDGHKEPNESPAACFLVPIMLCRLTEKFITASDGEVIGRPCLATWRLAHNYTVIHSLQGTFVPCICSTKQV